jgi:hypothetical protein
LFSAHFIFLLIHRIRAQPPAQVAHSGVRLLPRTPDALAPPLGRPRRAPPCAALPASRPLCPSSSPKRSPHRLLSPFTLETGARRPISRNSRSIEAPPPPAISPPLHHLPSTTSPASPHRARRSPPPFIFAPLVAPHRSPPPPLAPSRRRPTPVPPALR